VAGELSSTDSIPTYYQKVLFIQQRTRLVDEVFALHTYLSRVPYRTRDTQVLQLGMSGIDACTPEEDRIFCLVERDGPLSRLPLSVNRLQEVLQ
jgi:hypothetical protein